MNKLLLIGLASAPIALFASEGAVETDIVQRTVNFVIFAAILWYLLADKLKAFFAQRSVDIQSELDKVQDTLKASEKKQNDAVQQLEDSKTLAAEIVDGAKNDVDSIKAKLAEIVETEIANLSKNFDSKIEVETRKAKREIVNEILEELLSSDNVSMSQDELVNIVLKKVA